MVVEAPNPVGIALEPQQTGETGGCHDAFGVERSYRPTQLGMAGLTDRADAVRGRSGVRVAALLFGCHRVQGASRL